MLLGIGDRGLFVREELLPGLFLSVDVNVTTATIGLETGETAGSGGGCEYAFVQTQWKLFTLRPEVPPYHGFTHLAEAVEKG